MDKNQQLQSSVCALGQYCPSIWDEGVTCSYIHPSEIHSNVEFPETKPFTPTVAHDSATKQNLSSKFAHSSTNKPNPFSSLTTTLPGAHGYSKNNFSFGQQIEKKSDTHTTQPLVPSFKYTSFDSNTNTGLQQKLSESENDCAKLKKELSETKKKLFNAETKLSGSETKVSDLEKKLKNDNLFLTGKIRNMEHQNSFLTNETLEFKQTIAELSQKKHELTIYYEKQLKEITKSASEKNLLQQSVNNPFCRSIREPVINNDIFKKFKDSADQLYFSKNIEETINTLSKDIDVLERYTEKSHIDLMRQLLSDIKMAFSLKDRI